MKLLLITLSATLLLAGCNSGTHDVGAGIIEQAQDRCKWNGGIDYIRNGDMRPEYEGCGFKCSRATGRIEQTAKLVCNNGAMFELKVIVGEKK